MGVTGLWRLIEPAGKPVPIETLENKVLAVDISIWLHQVVKGYQDARGAPLPNAHLMGLFQRLCKLLYFRIKPVFVFDGAFPELKRETIAKRQDNKAKYNSESERLKREVLLLLSKKTAISNILGKETSPKKTIRSNSLQNSNDDDIFKLPVLPPQEHNSSTESESEDETSSGSIVDLHSVDIESNNFKSLPVKEKYEMLLELKDSRKMNSWGKLHELPKKSDNFSDFQMQRLLKRRKVQECLEETEKEIGDGCMSLNEIETLLNADGIDTQMEKIPTQRVASSDTARIIFIKDVKQALDEAKKRQKEKDVIIENNDSEPSTSENNTDNSETIDSNNKVNELDEDLKKAIQMSLECQNEPNSSSFITESNTSKSSRSGSLDSSYMLESDYSDSDHDVDLPDMSSAKAYIMQYSDFTYKAIDDMVKATKIHKSKSHTDNLEKILKELNEEKSIIMAKIDLSSDEDKIQNNLNTSDQNSQFYNASQSSIKIIEKEDCSIITLDSDADSSALEQKCDGDFKSNFINDDFEEILDDSPIEVIRNKDCNIITLDSSTDTSALEQKYEDDFKSNSTEDSSDNDFEEVPDEMEQCAKPSVQLHLKLNEALSDDIFADVFVKHTKDENFDNTIEEKNSEQFIINAGKNVVSEIIEQKRNVTIHVEKITTKHDDNKTNPISDIRKKNDGEIMERLTTLHDDNNANTRPIKNQEDDNSQKFEETTTKKDVAPIKELDTQNITPNTIPNQFTKEKLQSISDAIEIEENNLCKEKARLDRISRNITEEMTKEVQELLQVFGIPYIVAPMEAEAQCAFLEQIKLTDGTITDDSDIWLFGGHTVYKNFFNQKKHVLQFLSDRIDRSFNLSREKLVLLALLVGSDYTTGVTGVGPVTAMEILASFPYNKRELTEDIPHQIRYSRLIAGLQDFKKWVRSGKRTDNTILKKKLKNVDVADDFPSSRVVEAYFEPNVDKREDTFTWGELDITILRDYAKTKFGWSQNKLDEIINPVIKRLSDRKNQKTMQNYFKRKTDFECLEDQMSKRVKAAVQKMGPAGSGEMEDDSVNKIDSQPKNRVKKVNKRKKIVKIENNEVNTNTSLKNISEETSKSLQLLKKIPTVRVCDDSSTSSKFDIKVPKFNQSQEIIPQREKDKQCVLQNRMKAIEIFRKSKIDKKYVKAKKKVIQPKDDAGLSDSDTE